MKKRSDRQILNDLKIMYNRKVSKLNGPVPESFSQFYYTTENRARVLNMDIKEAARKRLNAIDYTSYEERIHKNAIAAIKSEGMYSRLYRMGGKTAFDASKFNNKKLYRDINGESYHASGSYMMGTVKVIFWTADIGSVDQFIEFIPMVGSSWLQKRHGQAHA